MSRGNVKECAEAIRGRYKRTKRKEKGRILDEFTQATGYHRKAASRLLGRGPRAPGHGRRGRPRKYGPEVMGGLRVVWEVTDHLCAKRLKPFLPELVSVVEQKGHHG